MFFNYFSKLKLVQDLDGFGNVENFLISSISTILLTRIYLNLTGFPQIGGGGLHIAHMLWGGLLLATGILFSLLFIGQRVKFVVAIISGIGFGLFIDELGKFITSNNDYFFQPTIAIIYLVFVGLFLLLSLLKAKMVITDEEYLANAYFLLADTLTTGIDAEQRKRLEEYLAKAGKKTDFNEIFKVKDNKSKKSHHLSMLKFGKNRFTNFTDRLITSKKILIGLLVLIELKAVAYFSFILLLILALTGFFGNVSEQTPEIDLVTIVQIFATFLTTILAISAVFIYPISKLKSFIFLKYHLLITIFVVQFFNFLNDQLFALIGLVFSIINLLAVNKIIINLRSIPKVR